MTLIEVLGALVLLAILTTSFLVAKGQFLRQQSAAERRLDAAQAADALLSQWWQEKDHTWEEAAGGFEAHPGLTWRLVRLPHDQVDDMELELLQLEVRETQQSAAGKPLVKVTFFNPKPPAVEPETPIAEPSP